MADFTTNKVTGSQLTAAEWNQMADVDNFTSSSDQTPATGDLNQIGKGVAAYTGQAGIYTTDSGVADAYVVTQVSPFKAPHKLFVGLTIRFRTSNTNTGACTVNAFTLGVKNIKLDDGSSDPAAGDISTTKENVAVYDGTVFRLKRTPADFEKISQTTISSDATIDFTGLEEGYDYLLKIRHLIPTTDATTLWLRTSANNGSSYDSGASDYQWGKRVMVGNTTPTFPDSGDEADSEIELLSNLGNDNTAETLDMDILLHNPAATQFTTIQWQGSQLNPNPQQITVTGSGARMSKAVANAFRILMSSGNLASGTVTLYRIKL